MENIDNLIESSKDQKENSFEIELKQKKENISHSTDNLELKVQQ